MFNLRKTQNYTNNNLIRLDKNFHCRMWVLIQLFYERSWCTYPHGLPESPTSGQLSYLPFAPTGIMTTCLKLITFNDLSFGLWFLFVARYCCWLYLSALFLQLTFEAMKAAYLIKNTNNFRKIWTHRSRRVNNQKYCH